jgi:hypothetical protein|tara:strand:- start:816 stop:1037 length:222 start_codon:yes stop_codon:yes gene_type:complete
MGGAARRLPLQLVREDIAIGTTRTTFGLAELLQKMEYLAPERMELVYEVPLAEVVIDFFDQMKSRTVAGCGRS